MVDEEDYLRWNTPPDMVEPPRAAPVHRFQPAPIIPVMNWAQPQQPPQQASGGLPGMPSGLMNMIPGAGASGSGISNAPSLANLPSAGGAFDLSSIGGAAGGDAAAGGGAAGGAGGAGGFAGAGAAALPFAYAALIGLGKNSEANHPNTPGGDISLGLLGPSAAQLIKDPIGMGLPALLGVPFLAPFLASKDAKAEKPEWSGLLPGLSNLGF